MDVYITNRQRDLEISSTQAEEIVKAVIQFENWDTHEISLQFVGRDEISALHKEYFDDPTPTDCISFPLDNEEDEHYHVLGEVVVCPLAAIDHVDRHGGDAHEEAALYIVHGLLHLMGYDDISESDRKMMRQAEKRHMRHLRTIGLALNP